ncbi:CDP-alcohol phosphatidyltransferase family protein [Streptomyces sediminimaris]|uniref:CDP-alcohol phosphatidyltransferase family protein n=1 Tax=Streptomyces sediminimaris TaxID=3383721 RepID=UPI00399BBDAA
MSLSDLPSSRAATDALLRMLRQDHWRPRALGRFLSAAARRSVRQASLRPRALAEATAVHSVLLVLARDRAGQRWVLTSWTLVVLHLGLLEHRDRLAPADALSLVRGNLPATALGARRWSGLVAIALDLADGHLARRLTTVTPFGDYADSLADAAYWTWLAIRYEPSRTLRVAAVAAWTVPVAAMTAVGISRGAMPDRPRPSLLRPAAALQALIGLRRLRRVHPSASPYRPASAQPGLRAGRRHGS